MWLILLIFLTNSLDFEKKEEVCLIAAQRSLKERIHEINDYMKTNTLISSPSIKPKLIEDSFELCIETITIEELQNFNRNFLRDFKNYSHLVMVPLTKYKNLQDVKLSPSFSDKRNDIMKRVSMKSREF